MWRQIASVGGLTLLSRLFGFVRDVLMAGLLGAGPLADAFMVAFRLPNHFRAIFAEGAFNAAFLPRYGAILATRGKAEARSFASRILGLMLIVQLVLLGAALLATPTLVALLAPGFVDDPQKFGWAVDFTRITFPYLAFMAVETLVAGMLNSHERFAAAAGASILLNLCMIGALFLAPWFPSAAHALAWAVAVSGAAQLLLVLWDLRATGQGLGLMRPRLDPDTRAFLRAFGPAVLGAAGVQIALFADTIIASFLPTGSVSYLYYADRLYQLPLAVIGIAVGTVLLPDLSKRIASGDEAGAGVRLVRAIEGIVVLTLPFVVLFVLAGEPIVAVLFGRGAFDAAAIRGSASALAAYAVGLTAVVVLRALTNAFHARGDTATPVKALAAATLVNVALKLALVGSLAHVGLALATAVGAWVNATLLLVLLVRAGRLPLDGRLARIGGVAAAAALAMAGILVSLEPAVRPLAALVPELPDLLPIALRGGAAVVAYILVLGIGWRLFRGAGRV